MLKKSSLNHIFKIRSGKGCLLFTNQHLSAENWILSANNEINCNEMSHKMAGTL